MWGIGAHHEGYRELGVYEDLMVSLSNHEVRALAAGHPAN
jgi:hypothetical protein